MKIDLTKMPNRMTTRLLLIGLAALLALSIPSLSMGEVDPRGLDPLPDATYIPELGGLLNKIHHNQYGQKRELSECLVLRRSNIKEGKAYVSAGGLFYSSETSYDARPLMRDPFLILGEHTYLVRSTHEKAIKRDVIVKKGEKELIDPSGYRIWFDYSTDHYRKPYGEFALISPAGGWPYEWPISTSFPEAEAVKDLNLSDGIHPQLKDFIMSSSYIYGATKLVAEEITFGEAKFSVVEYPVIKDAVFSMERPWIMEIRQESYRWYGNKRIYAFRKETGILVEVRNWTGKKVLVSKLLVPSTQQEYHIMDQDKMCLTDFDLDIHIEIITQPTFNKESDYSPWVNDVPYGWQDGVISFAVYNDLVKVEDGKPWPRDERYIVRLEPNYETGMLKRLILENKDAFVLSDENPEYLGPTKISEVWDRPYFKVVAKDFEDDVVHDCYVRDSFFQRTDDLILWKEGRDNIDFFIGMSPLVVSVMEDTFLQRLADPSYGVPVVQSRFTSYPQVIPDAKWFAPDPTAAFVPKMKGFVRKKVKSKSGGRLYGAETLVIRRSYIDYRHGKIIIPPGGLYYCTRDNRNIRPGEGMYILGKKAYLLSFKSYLVVKKNFRIDLWKEQPMGDGNLLFWQDVPLGDGSKAIRYMGSKILWGRPVAELRITKYSGNTWGANIMVAPGLYSFDDFPEAFPQEGNYPQDHKYFVPEVFAEGATYLIPKWVTPDFVEVAEMGTPGMDQFTITYKKPKKAVLKEGDQVKVGEFYLKVNRVDAENNQVDCVLTDSTGNVLVEKSFGPLTEDVLSTLPQYSPSQDKIQLQHEDIHVALDVPMDFAGFPEGKATFYLSTDIRTFDRD
ncbi:MAG: hypothetical protein JRI43_03615, partial [Deltaproteobacteria bacterium]|nr:hypothetical protein [Deltaproteobacteria bacterium]